MATGMTLYELGQEMQALDELLFEVGGELTPEMESWIDEYQLAERSKVDAYGRYAQNQLAEAKACREEAERLTARARACENRVERLKEMARRYLEARGLTKVQGATFTVAIQRNGGKPPIVLHVAEHEVPPEFTRTVTSLNKDALREALEAGDVVAQRIATIGETGTSVRIR